MKKITSMVLLLCILLTTFSGCNSDAKDIIGSWTADINYAAAVNAGIYSADGMEDMGDYFKFDEFYLTTTFTFLEDGTYKVELDALSVFNAVKGIRGHMEAGMQEYIQDEIRKAGLNISASSYLGMLGLNWTTLGEMLFSDYTMGKVAEELSKGSAGHYRVEKGKLYMTENLETELGEDNYDTYSLDGDTLTLLECHCQQEEILENVTKELYPVILKRVTP